ncbi:MAG: MmcQ/YjbR family DNA-binding protein [Hydrogenophilaceae bacterium]|jgi:hypothetical protein|nr:MmcQ/YjbR family DNA-binding protein [Hydrogenophilaceae bacterium]
MAVTPARARALALALPDAEERPHVDRFAFRTPRKTFATLAGDGRDINLMFDHALQEHYCAMAPEAFEVHPSGWGRMGITRCALKRVDAATLASALQAAHALAQPKPKAARKRKAKP